MINQTKRNIVNTLKYLLNVFGVTREEAPEVLAQTLTEYAEYFEMPKEVAQ